MNKQIKFGLGVSSTILAGVAAVNIRQIVRPISDLLGLKPAVALTQPLKIVSPARSVTTDLPAKAVTDFLSEELP
jgi:hypothetical protein